MYLGFFKRVERRGNASGREEAWSWAIRGSTLGNTACRYSCSCRSRLKASASLMGTPLISGVILAQIQDRKRTWPRPRHHQNVKSRRIFNVVLDNFLDETITPILSSRAPMFPVTTSMFGMDRTRSIGYTRRVLDASSTYNCRFSSTKLSFLADNHSLCTSLGPPHVPPHHRNVS